MNTIFDRIYSWFKTPLGKRTLLLIVTFIVASLFLRQCNLADKYQREKTQYEQNASYLKDSLIITKNKVGELEYTRSVFATDLKELKDQNKSLYDDVKKQYGMVVYISKITGNLRDSISILAGKVGTGNINSGTNPDGSKFINFSNDTTYSIGNERHVAGKVDFRLNKDTIDKNSIKVNLTTKQKFTVTTGLEEDKDSKLLKIFVNPGSPNMTISSVDGALIDPQKSDLIKSYFKPKRITGGPQLGVGLTTGLKPTIYVGIGIQYNLYWSDVKNLFKK